MLIENTGLRRKQLFAGHHQAVPRKLRPPPVRSVSALDAKAMRTRVKSTWPHYIIVVVVVVDPLIIIIIICFDCLFRPFLLPGILLRYTYRLVLFIVVISYVSVYIYLLLLLFCRLFVYTQRDWLVVMRSNTFNFSIETRSLWLCLMRLPWRPPRCGCCAKNADEFVKKPVSRVLCWCIQDFTAGQIQQTASTELVNVLTVARTISSCREFEFDGSAKTKLAQPRR